MEIWNKLPKEAQELQFLKIRLLEKGRTDVVFFGEYFLGLRINDFQKRYLNSPSKQNLVVCGNQVGKTVAIAILHIHHCFYKIYLEGDPDVLSMTEYKTLNLSPISRQSKKAFSYVESILTSSFTWEYNGVREANKCKIEWFLIKSKEYMGIVEFANNSTFICVSTHQDKGASIQGEQFGLITYDEAPQSYHLKDELDARIFSRIARLSGRVDLIGTPDDQAKSQQYWFHMYTVADKAQKEGTDAEWMLFKGYYDDNIFIPFKKRMDFKKRMKRRNPILYAQVVLGDFTVAANRMFSPKMIEAYWNDKIEATKPIAGRKYVISVDWGVANQGDNTVFKVADYTDLENVEIVRHYQKRGGDPIELMTMLQFLRVEYNDAKVVLDTASLGGVVFKKMLAHIHPISFPQQEKANALTFLQMRLRANLKSVEELKDDENSGIKKLKSYYVSTDENELSAYQVEDKKLTQDAVMTLAQLCWFLDKYIKASKIKTFKLKIKGGPPAPIIRGSRRESARQFRNNRR